MLEKHPQYWEMAHPFYHDKRCQMADPQWDTLIKFKEAKIGPSAWKTFRTYANDQGNAATA